jgi:hypothetical protein
MRWPWTSRKTLEALEARLKWTEDQLRPVEEHRSHIQAMLANCLVQEAKLTLQLEASEKERKSLLDRIMQMSGQPALYAKPVVPQPAVIVPPLRPEEPAESEDPPKLTVDKLRADYRKQLQKGKVDVERCRVRI